MYFKRLIGLLALGAVLLSAAPALAASITVRASNTVNVRSGPGTTYSVIGKLYSGDTATATGRSDTSNAWFRISYNGSEGWVAASVVTLQGDPTTLTIVSASSAVSTVGNTDITAAVAETVNLRAGPGLNYAVVGTTAASGSTLDATGRTRLVYPLMCSSGRLVDLSDGDADYENVWVRVNHNGASAWVSYAYVTLNASLCGLDEATVDTAASSASGTLVGAGEALIVTRNNTNLRASNFPTAEILAVVPFNTTLTAEARDTDGTRVRVTYDGTTGWIAVSQIGVIAGSIDGLPVEEE